MSLSTYDLSIPIFVRALEQLVNVLKAGEKWCEEQNVDKSKLLEGKLCSDMLPLTFQVQTCSNTSKGVAVRVGGETAVSMEDNEKTFPELYARLEKTIEVLNAAKKEKFAGPDATVEMKLGPKEVKFTAIDYLQKFAIPNYFFHHTMAYAILRQAGVPVGKMIYLGGGDLLD